MLVTSHGGSFGTGRNTKRYFDTIKDYLVDVIEVDVWACGDLLYISHLPRLFPKRSCLTLRFVFEFIKEHKFMVNCDVKQGGLVKRVTDLAKEMGVEKQILFTGSVKEYELNDTCGDIYLNKSFFKLKPIGANVGLIKARIERCGAKNVKGINFNYKFLTDDFLHRCAQADLKISTFTVDDEVAQVRLLNYPAIVNMTSNMPDVTLKLLNRPVKRPRAPH